eukprot:1284308-Heterocapsa_arctica.AAC.1
MDTQEDCQVQDPEEVGQGSTRRTRKVSHAVTSNFDGRGTTRMVTTVVSSDSGGDAASVEDVVMDEGDDEDPQVRKETERIWE